MSNIIRLNEHCSREICFDVETICQPLKQFRISYFAYSRIFNNGAAYVFVTHPDSMYLHWKKEYPVCPYIPESFEGKKFHYIPFLSDNTSPEEKKTLEDYRNLFNITQPIYFLERYKGFTDFYCYSSHSNNLGMINFYLNNLDILEKFKLYFKDKAQKLIRKANEKKLQFTKKMYSPWEPTLVSSLDKPTFINQLNIQHGHLSLDGDNIQLTKRELDVLSYLAKGCTVKETAAHINIAARTVENYFNSIKSKMGTRKKSEIIKIASEAKFL